MTKEELAAKLDGVEYGKENSNKELMALAEESGLVIVIGASDDLVEIYGAIRDERGAWRGKTIYAMNHDGLAGIIPEHDKCECFFCGYENAKKLAKPIRAKWREGDYSWVIETDIPHATFDVMEDDKKFCRGIVFSLDDLQLVQNKSKSARPTSIKVQVEPSAKCLRLESNINLEATPQGMSLEFCISNPASAGMAMDMKENFISHASRNGPERNWKENKS